MRPLRFQKVNLQKEDILNRETLRQIRGGNDGYNGDGGPRCKTAANTCTFYVPPSRTYTGKCGETITLPMQGTQCGCTLNQETQPATECRDY